jgi:hypothetical protein
MMYTRFLQGGLNYGVTNCLLLPRKKHRGKFVGGNLIIGGNLSAEKLELENPLEVIGGILGSQ